MYAIKKEDGYFKPNFNHNASRGRHGNLYNMEVFPMICPKCDSRFYEDEHCSFCGFVLTRHPSGKEKKETRAVYGRERGANFKHMGIENPTEYTIDDYSITKIRQERFIREAM
jgi:hypothetical protein